MQKQQETMGRVEQLEKEVWSIAKETVPAIKDEVVQQLEQGTLAQIQETLSALSAKVEQISGGGSVVDVIYDYKSEDPQINQGLISGAKGDSQIAWSGDYSIFRVYASLGGTLAYREIPAKNRPCNDITLCGMSAAGYILHYLKAVIYDSQKKIYVGTSYTYMLDPDTGLTEFQEDTKQDYFITRIEGVK